MRYVKPTLVTLLSVGGVTLLKVWLQPYLPSTSPLLLYTSAVIISAWYGGFGQGLVATAFTILLSYEIFVSPDARLIGEYPWRYVLFFTDCILVSWLCGALRRYKVEVKQTQAINENTKRSLKETEIVFKNIFESNMMGFLFCDITGRVLNANEYFLNMLGYDRQDLAEGLVHLRRITSPEDDHRSIQAIQEVIDKGFIAPFEKEYVRKDGNRVSAMVGATLINSETFVSFVMDISSRKRDEKALTEAFAKLEEHISARTEELRQANQELTRVVDDRIQSEKFLDSVIENIPNMIFVKDAKDLRFVRFNKAGEELLGYPQAALVGKNDYDFFPKEEADFFTAKDRAVFDGRKAVDIPEEMITTKYGLRYLHTKKIPVMDKDGQPLYLLGISEDITKQKEVENQRITLLHEQAAKERLRFLSEASAALTETLDTDTMLRSFAKVIVADFADWCMIDLVNDSGEEDGSVLLHRNPELIPKLVELKSKFPIDYHKDTGITRALQLGQARLISDYTDDLLKARIGDPENIRIVKDIGLKSNMIVPLKSYGKILGALTLISSTRNYNELDLSIAEDLARRASYAIENTRLYTRAQEANRAKSAFLANMSHEIRTPLGAMLGFAELLLEQELLNSEQVQFAATIRRNGQQLLKIVDEILDISKVESERIFIEKVPFSLASLLDDVSSLLRRQIADKPIDLTVQIVTPLPDRIVTDPTRLRQILINVIGNAIKFTEKGKIEVSVELARKDKKEILKVSVIDTGIGITQEQAQRLFQPFSQADSSMTRRFGGTGLGLFLSKKLAHLLGGDLTLGRSAPGQGSCFEITIEVISQYGVGVGVEIPPPSLVAKIPLNAKGKVLIVDDSPDNRALVQFFIAKLSGMTMDEAENGSEGVAKALTGKYNLILMDIQMPGMDGFEAVRTLRAKNYKGLIIALTAHAMKGDRENCLNSGFDDYICKPINLSAFEACIRRYVLSERWKNISENTLSHSS